MKRQSTKEKRARVLFMEIVLMRCRLEDIRCYRIDDRLSIDIDHTERAKQIIHDTLIEFGILQESTKNELVKLLY